MSHDLAAAALDGPNVATAHQMALEANAAQRRGRVFDLRVAGYTFRQIAKAEGVSIATAHKDWQLILAEHMPPAESVEQQRELEVTRADDGIARCSLMLESATPEQKPKILETRLRFQQHRAKLLGLYMPEQIRVEATVGVEVDGSLTITPLDWERALALRALTQEIRPLIGAGDEAVIDVEPVSEES